MHASLMREHVDVARVVALCGLEPLEQTLEERQTAVGEINGVQLGLVHTRLLRSLLHHSRQLLMVADEHEAAYGVLNFEL